MVAIRYRMQAGFPGDPNRAHPFSIEPCLIDPTNPPVQFGHACIINPVANSVRAVAAGDSALTRIWGVIVRPYPFQQFSATNYGAAAFGQATPPSPGSVDVLRWGYIMVLLNVGAPQPVKGGPAFIWVAATSGNHIQGGFETAASAGNTIALDVNQYNFNGPGDALGNTELIVNS